MVTTRAFVEEECAGAIVASQPLDLITHGMAVHKVHDDLEACSVGGINERFQFVRRTKAATRCEEA